MENLIVFLQFVLCYCVDQPIIPVVGFIALVTGILFIQFFGGNSRVEFIEENFMTNTGTALIGLGIAGMAFCLFCLLVTGDLPELSTKQIVLLTGGTVIFLGWSFICLSYFLIIVWEEISKIRK